jgi:hypothetical protein
MQPPRFRANAGDTEMGKSENIRAWRYAVDQLMRPHTVAVGCVRRHVHDRPPVIVPLVSVHAIFPPPSELLSNMRALSFPEQLAIP